MRAPILSVLRNLRVLACACAQRCGLAADPIGGIVADAPPGDPHLKRLHDAVVGVLSCDYRYVQRALAFAEVVFDLVAYKAIVDGWPLPGSTMFSALPCHGSSDAMIMHLRASENSKREMRRQVAAAMFPSDHRWRRPRLNVRPRWQARSHVVRRYLR